MMPHIIIEYSENLSADLDISALTHELHGALNGMYNVTQDRLKTRAIRLDDFLVGTHGTSGKMIHITLKLMTGRTTEARKEMGGILASVTKKYIPAETALTVEIVELDKETYFA
jgi:5-carboxymethyl-2-hydroxymuconate isomerase